MVKTKVKPFRGRLKSDFAILDVTTGRKKLADHFGGVSQLDRLSVLKVPVVIHGFIDDQWGGDDGTSIEFSVEVTKVELVKEGS